MKTLQGLCFLLFLLCVFASCEEDEILEQEKLVIEGWIEQGSNPVVQLTKNLVLGDDPILLDTVFYNHLIRYARVSVSDGEKTVVLTGKKDERYLPPYIYTTGNMKGEVGKTYELRVEYDDFFAKARTNIPAPPMVQDLVAEEVSPRLYTIKAYLKDNPKEHNYYCTFVKESVDSRQFLFGYLGCYDDAWMSEPYEIVIHPGKDFLKEEYLSSFVEGDSVSVKIASVDAQTYSFWKEYNATIWLSNSQFFPSTSNLPSNIEGGLGYWCGFGSWRRDLIVGRNSAK